MLVQFFDQGDLVKQMRKGLTYANVMSTIAVFVVLGGAAVAATQLPKNSVGSKQLKKNAVTPPKIKKNAVTGAKVKPGSLDASDFAVGQLPRGAQGPAGPAGPEGPAGKDAFGELIYVEAEQANPTGTQNFVMAECPGGYFVTGGGVFGSIGALGQNINSSFPIENTAWAGWVNNESAVNGTIQAFAVCAKAGKVSGP